MYIFCRFSRVFFDIFILFRTGAFILFQLHREQFLYRFSVFPDNFTMIYKKNQKDQLISKKVRATFWKFLKIFEIENFENFHWNLYENFQMPTLSCSNFLRFQRNFLILFIDHSKIVWKDRKSVRELLSMRLERDRGLGAPQTPTAKNVKKCKISVFFCQNPEKSVKKYIHQKKTKLYGKLAVSWTPKRRSGHKPYEKGLLFCRGGFFFVGTLWSVPDH